MPPPQDWTTGPAKWAAVMVLGGASIVGLAWSIWTRPPRSALIGAASPSVVIDPDEPTEPDSPQTRPATLPRTSATAVLKISVNTASASELELLPAVGPAMAARIVEYRSKNGPFRSVDDLVNVKGIGPRTLEKLRPLVTTD